MTRTVNFMAKRQQSKLGEQSNDPLEYLFKEDKNYSMLILIMFDFASLGLSFLNRKKRMDNS